MNKVIGIGGIFFKSKDPVKLREWYRDNLGFQTTDWGASIISTDNNGTYRTEWSPFKETTNYIEPSKLPYMINYRVKGIKQLVDSLRNEGVTIVGGVDETEYGNFAWIMDPEGRKIELYEPAEDSDIPPAWTDKVVGLASISFKSDNPVALKEWYRKHLGIEGHFAPDVAWSPLPNDDKVFSGTDKPYVFSYHFRGSEPSSNIIDPDGNKVILIKKK
jgi:predicted enzyme related to lactoylglutathione lyase